MSDKKPTPQEFAELVKRHKELDTQRTRAQAQLEEAEKRLEQTKLAAREKFGTDDINELRRQFEEMKKNNLAKREEYQARLDSIEAQLQNIDAAHRQAGA